MKDMQEREREREREREITSPLWGGPPPPPPFPPSLPRGRSGWSGGRAGSNGAVPSPSGKLGDRGGTEVQSRCDLNKMRSNLRAKDKTKQEMKTRDRKGRTSARRDRKGNYISPFGGLPLPIPQAFREGGVDGVVEGLALIERRLPPPESLGIEVGLKFVGRLI